MCDFHLRSMGCWFISVWIVREGSIELFGKYSARTTMDRPSPKTCLPCNLALSSFKDDGAERTASSRPESFPQHTSLSGRMVSSAVASTADGSADGAVSKGRLATLTS